MPIRELPHRAWGIHFIHIRFLLLVVWAIAFWAAPPAASAGEPIEIGLAGSGDVVWAYQRSAEDDGPMLLRFAYRRATKDVVTRFLRLRLPPVSGRIALAVVVNPDLHVFFADGTHRRYLPAGSAWADWPTSSHHVEGSLPDSALPAAVGTDRIHHVLYALVTAQQAVDAESRNTSLQRKKRSESIDASSQPEHMDEDVSFGTPAMHHSLLRYEDGQWRRDRDGPIEITLNDAVLHLSVSNRIVHLVYRKTSNGSTVVHQRSDSPIEPWNAPSAWPLAFMPTFCTSGLIDEKLMFLVGEAANEGTKVRCLSVESDTPVLGVTLLDDRGNPQIFAPPMSATIFQNRVAVARVDESGLMEVGVWSPSSGRPVEPKTVVKSLSPLPKPAMSRAGRGWIQYLVLAAVLTAVFVWRRSSVLLPASLGPRQDYAKLSIRMLALFVDMTIVMPVWAVVLYRLWMPPGSEATLLELVQLSPSEMSEGMFWSQAVVGGIIGIYAAVFEAIMGCTPGKRLFGLSVVSEGGQRCRLGPTLVRNLARIIEFEFVPIVLLVAFTPSRQRLGDILARTVVVSPVMDDPTESSSETDHTPDNPTDN